MRKCPHCDKNISDYVIKCSHCGKPVDVDAGAIVRPVFTPRSPAASARKEEPPKNVAYAEGDDDAAQALSIPKAGGGSVTSGEGPSNIPSPSQAAGGGTAPRPPAVPPAAPPASDAPAAAATSSAAVPSSAVAAPLAPATPQAPPRQAAEPFSTEIPKGDPYWVMKPDAERPAMITSPAAQAGPAPTAPAMPAPPGAPSAPASAGGPASSVTTPTTPAASLEMPSPAGTKTASKVSGTVPAALSIAGGAVAIVGAMLTWASAQATIPGQGKKAADIALHTSVKGTSAAVGIAVAGLGVVLIILGLSFLLGTGNPATRMGRLKAAVLPGVLILGIAGYAFATKNLLVKPGFLSSAESSGVAVSDAQSLFSQLTASGQLAAALGAGVMVAAVGGLLGVLAGVVALVGGRGRR